MSEPLIAGTKSAVLELEAGEYWWCACGRSSNQPWCDGSHKGTEFSPRKVNIEEKKRYAFCACKRSNNGAFCDGSHKTLPKKDG